MAEGGRKLSCNVQQKQALHALRFHDFASAGSAALLATELEPVAPPNVVEQTVG